MGCHEIPVAATLFDQSAQIFAQLESKPPAAGSKKCSKQSQNSLRSLKKDCSETPIRGFEKGLAGGGFGNKHTPKKSPKKFSRNVSPSPKGGIGKRVQKRGLNLWHMTDFLVPTPSVRQPLFETSETPKDCFASDFLEDSSGIPDPEGGGSFKKEVRRRFSLCPSAPRVAAVK